MKKQVVILSKELCQGCNQLRLFLRAALKDKYADQIVNIKLEENEEDYRAWADKLDTMQVPTLALVVDGEIQEVVRGFNPADTKRIFEDNFNV